MSEEDIYLFREGTHARLHRLLGCHLCEPAGAAHFAVWAPNASAVSVIGDWNGWDGRAAPLAPRTDGSGIWEGSVQGVQQGHAYKYRITSRESGQVLEKADPVAFSARPRPQPPPAPGTSITPGGTALG